MANIELKAYRKLLLDIVYYNFLFRYTLTQKPRVRVSTESYKCSHAAALFMYGIYNLSRIGLMLSVHGKNGMHLIFLGNLLLKCFRQQSQDIQPYSDNQIKKIEKRCI